MLRLREFMAREYEHVRRFLSCRYPSARNPQTPLDNI